MSEAEQRPSHFEPVENFQEAQKLLNDCAKMNAPTLIWTQERQTTIHSRITFISATERSVYAWVPYGFDLKRFQEDLQTRGSDCFFSVSLQSANLFFKTKFIERNNAGLRFALPEKVFKVQRRKNERFAIPRDHLMWISFLNPAPGKTDTIRKKVLDISAGGVAFLADSEDQDLYQKGLVLKDIEITVRMKQIRSNATVQHQRPFEDPNKGKGIKVGIQFTNTSPEDVDLIESYVTEESQRYLSRFM